MSKITKYGTIIYNDHLSLYTTKITYHGETYRIHIRVNTSSSYCYENFHHNVADSFHFDITNKDGIKINANIVGKNDKYRTIWFIEKIFDKDYVIKAKKIYRNYKEEIFKMVTIGRGI